MIFLPHLLLGALIGQKISIPLLAAILALLSHYFLDFIPHTEYPIENIKNKNWRKIAPDITIIVFDLVSAILLIYLLSENSLIIYICATAAVSPDLLYILSPQAEKNRFLRAHSYFHHKIIHFLENKKISSFWRISSQIAVVIICVILLRN